MPLRFRRTKGTYRPGSRTSTTTRTSGGTWRKTVSSSTPSTTTGRVPYATYEGASGTHGGGVILWLSVLFIIVTFKDVTGSIINQAIPNAIATGTPLGESILATPDYRKLFGGIIFIAIAGMIAASSPTGSEIMVWMVVAMWLLFMMFNGSGTMSSVFGWLQGKTSTSTSTSSGTPTPNQTNTSTNTGTPTH